MDIVTAIAIAKQRYGDRLQYRAGDFHDDSFGGPYDAAFLSNIVHGESDAQVRDMFARLFAALAPGAWIMLKDMFIGDRVPIRRRRCISA